MRQAVKDLIAERLSETTINEKGFTLIELIMVIVILGILAAVAIPKFVDLSSSAETAATNGIAGAMGAAASINKAGCASNGYSNVIGVCVTPTNACTDAMLGALLDGGIPTGYAVSGTGTATTTVPITCTVTRSASTQATKPTATFILQGT